LAAYPILFSFLYNSTASSKYLIDSAVLVFLYILAASTKYSAASPDYAAFSHSTHLKYAYAASSHYLANLKLVAAFL